MATDWGPNTLTTQTGTLDAQADRFVSRSGSLAGAAVNLKEDSKIVKAGHDFESILLGSWLQQAEQSFAKVPGGDGQDDDDSGKDQFQGIAMQALAGSLTASGGIGISRMITSALRARQSSPVTTAAETSPDQAKADAGLNKTP